MSDDDSMHFTADRGKNVSHFTVLCYMDRLHYRMTRVTCTCKYEKMARTNVNVNSLYGIMYE